MKYFILVLFALIVAEFVHAQALPQSNILKGYAGQTIPNVTVTIANGATVSSVINQNGFSLAGCLFPAAMTGTTMTGTTMTLQMSADGTNFYPVYNSAGAVSYTIAAARYLAITTTDVQGAKYLKLVSGSAEGAARTLICSLKGM